MKIDNITLIDNLNDFLNKVINIRLKVFTDEQKIEKNIVFYGFDFKLVQYIVHVDNIPTSILIYNKTKEAHNIERVAIFKQYMSLLVVLLLIKFVLNDFKNHKKSIYLYFHKSGIESHKKLHFIVYRVKFVEAKIPHSKILYNK